MLNTPSSVNRPTPTPWPLTQAIGDWKRTVRTPQGKPAASPSRPGFDRVVIGLCLGGLVLGAAGCILGALMPYRHPVAVTMSMVWWGVYCGCFGASIGALIARLTRRASAVPCQGDGCEGDTSRPEPLGHSYRTR